MFSNILTDRYSDFKIVVVRIGYGIKVPVALPGRSRYRNTSNPRTRGGIMTVFVYCRLLGIQCLRCR